MKRTILLTLCFVFLTSCGKDPSSKSNSTVSGTSVVTTSDGYKFVAGYIPLRELDPSFTGPQRYSQTCKEKGLRLPMVEEVEIIKDIKIGEYNVCHWFTWDEATGIKSSGSNLAGDSSNLNCPPSDTVLCVSK